MVNNVSKLKQSEILIKHRYCGFEGAKQTLDVGKVL